MSALVVIQVWTQVCIQTFIIVVSCEADNYVYDVCVLVEFSKARLALDCKIKTIKMLG